jgi:hypothetical protein
MPTSAMKEPTAPRVRSAPVAVRRSGREPSSALPPRARRSGAVEEHYFARRSPRSPDRTRPPSPREHPRPRQPAPRAVRPRARAPRFAPHQSPAKRGREAQGSSRRASPFPRFHWNARSPPPPGRRSRRFPIGQARVNDGEVAAGAESNAVRRAWVRPRRPRPLGDADSVPSGHCARRAGGSGVAQRPRSPLGAPLSPPAA